MRAGVRNFFSGVESAQHYQAAIDAGAKHLLMSYLYVTKQSGNILATRKQQTPRLKFMIDSGAHTLQLNFDKPPYGSWTMRDYEKYVHDYADWLLKNKQYIFAAVELDIASNLNHVTSRPLDDPYGDSVIDDWRKRIFMPLQEKGLDIIYVWHNSQGHQGWETMCANLPYVGLPGEKSKHDDFNIFLSVARRYLTKVHGFAATKQSDFRDWPWYSIDSTTWKAGEIWGTLPVWDERQQKLKFLAKTDNREAYRQKFEDWHLDADKIINDTDYQEVTRASLKSMTEMEEFYRQSFGNKVFYYQLRLPHPNQILGRWKLPVLLRVWQRFNPAQNFKFHAEEKDPAKIVGFLHAIACVQYQCFGKLTLAGKAFLALYFKDYVNAPVPDTIRLAKELAILVSPGNEPAKRRMVEDDYDPTANPPKLRQASDLPALELDESIPTFLLDRL